MNNHVSFKAITLSVRRQLPALFVFSFLVNILLLVSAIYMLQIFDRVLTSGSVDTLLWLTVVTIAAIVVFGILELARRRLLTRISSWLDSEMGPLVVRQLIKSKLSKTPSQANLGDVSDYRAFYSGDAILTFLDAPWTPVFLFLIWLLHPVLGVVAITGAVVLLAVAALNNALTRSRHAEHLVQQRAQQAAATRYIEYAETVSVLGMTEALIHRWTDRLMRTQGLGLHVADTMTSLFSFSRATRLALQVFILGVGAYLVIQAELTPGGMIAGSIILSRALSPVERSITAWRSYAAYKAAKDRLAPLLREDINPTENLELPSPTGRLDIEIVKFSPSANDVLTLQNIKAQLAPGELCCVIGPSGSGKSTLCRLIVGAWRPDEGSVRLDGADVASWDPEQLGPYIGYLPQEVELFPGTIAENIARMQSASDEEIIEAAKLAGIHEMILGLPNGYDTEVGVHGGLLSGGQRQRIGLARAFFREPTLLILDEPNSNLDGEGELALLQAVASLKKRRRTMVIVTHQQNMLRAADKLMVINAGNLAAFGPRDEILKSLFPDRSGGARSPGTDLVKET